MKITEPKTPYHGPMTDSEGEDTDPHYKACFGAEANKKGEKRIESDHSEDEHSDPHSRPL